jgi:hypothetical protein
MVGYKIILLSLMDRARQGPKRADGASVGPNAKPGKPG